MVVRPENSPETGAEKKGRKIEAAASELEFEEAARLRDEIRRLEEIEIGLATAHTHVDASGRAKTLVPRS